MFLWWESMFFIKHDVATPSKHIGTRWTYFAWLCSAGPKHEIFGRNLKLGHKVSYLSYEMLLWWESMFSIKNVVATPSVHIHIRWTLCASWCSAEPNHEILGRNLYPGWKLLCGSYDMFIRSVNMFTKISWLGIEPGMRCRKYRFSSEVVPDHQFT